MSGGSDVNRGNMRGVTPVHLGAESGSTAVMQVLLSEGAVLDAVDVNEDTPLHYTARAGEEATAALLLHKGCDVTRFNQHGDNALLTAIKNNNENIVALFLRSLKWKDAVKARTRPNHHNNKSGYFINFSNAAIPHRKKGHNNIKTSQQNYDLMSL